MQTKKSKNAGKREDKSVVIVGKIEKANSKVPTESNTEGKYTDLSPRTPDMLEMPGHQVREIVWFMAGNRKIEEK